jgi:hypothetical protein
MAVVSIQDIRDAGIDASVADDDAVQDAIDECEEIFNTETGQFFEPVQATMVLDGDNTSSFFLAVPVISVDSITDNERSVTLDAESYRVYAGRQHGINDDRRNPRIYGKNGTTFYYGPGRWSIVGTFGYTEPDDSAPRQVKSAIIALVIDNLLTPVIEPAQDLPQINEDLLGVGPITEEVTDDHKQKYAYLKKPSPWDPYEAASKIPKVRRAIKNFRAPFGIAAPTSFVARTDTATFFPFNTY